MTQFKVRTNGFGQVTVEGDNMSQADYFNVLEIRDSYGAVVAMFNDWSHAAAEPAVK